MLHHTRADGVVAGHVVAYADKVAHIAQRTNLTSR
jgi:hypothetical protein